MYPFHTQSQEIVITDSTLPFPQVGHNTDYVRAGDHPADFSKFIRDYGGNKPTGGIVKSLQASIAQKKAGQSFQGGRQGVP